MLIFKRFCTLLLLLCLLHVGAHAQCPLISHRGFSEDTYINHNFMVTWGDCEGPSCPIGVALYIGLSASNYCSDEPAYVYMSRDARPYPLQGIIIKYAIEGQRSQTFYQFGYKAEDCDGFLDEYNSVPEPCVVCDLYSEDSCYNTGDRSATCTVSPWCTTSCADLRPTASIVGSHSCYETPWERYYVEVWGFSRFNDPNFAAGAYTNGAIYQNGQPWCTGHLDEYCNGGGDEFLPSCTCPQP